MAIKFFVQKDISKEIQAEVCENIAVRTAHSGTRISSSLIVIQTLGGRVEGKVPRAGYVLIQPGTAEEERLRTCWSSADRPERHFVPYTFVEACKIAGMLLKQIFVEEGQPIRMHIDSSIANVNVRVMLAQRITVSLTFSACHYSRILLILHERGKRIRVHNLTHTSILHSAFRWRSHSIRSER